MLPALLHLCGTAVLTGALLASPLDNQSTVPLKTAETLVFLGISGDYKAVSPDDLSAWLAEEEVVVVGDSIRAMGDFERRVWAVQGKDANKVIKGLKSGLKKKGFKATALKATALTPLDAGSRSLNGAMREVEAQEKKIWTVWSSRRSSAVWVFHEKKITSKKIEGLFRKTKDKMTFHHQEFCFAADLGDGKPQDASFNINDMTEAASSACDSLRVVNRDGALAMDLYMRDMESMLLLSSESGRKSYLCPNVWASSLKRLQVEELGWKVTFEDTGFPFVK